MRFAIAAAALGLVAGSAAAVSATVGLGGGAALDGGEGPSGTLISERLTGYEETPLALSTAGNGTFRAMVTDAGIEYTLTYADLVDLKQAHIHFGAVGQTGGVSAFLCTNLGNGPEGTPACPAAPASVSGLIEPSDVVAGAAAQLIAAGEYDELVAAIRKGSAYVNVHTGAFLAGEIRGQIDKGNHH